MVMGPAAAASHEPHDRHDIAPPLQPATEAASPRIDDLIAEDGSDEDVIDADVIDADVVDIEGPLPVMRAPAAAPVIEARAIETPVAEAPTVAPRPAMRADDPLAPIMALSAEEKIALFT
jgi:hypothetical protein